MYARIATAQIRPERLEAALAAGDTPNSERDAAMAQLAREPGFKGTQSFIDRQTGKAMTIGLWESEATLQASLPGHQARLARAVAQGLYVAPPVMEIYELTREVRPHE